MKKAVVSRVGDPRALSLLSFFGVYFIACAAVAPFMARSFGENAVVFTAVLLMMLMGYCMQAAVCAATGFKRELETRAYEPEYKYYRKERALPVLIAAFIMSLLVGRLTDLYLLERSKQPMQSYDPDSLVPILVAAVFFVAVALGSFVWFFPYNRIMTAKGLYIGIGAELVIFAFHVLIGRQGGAIIGICVMGYAFCALLAANQSSLGRTYLGTVVSFMTPQARRYNILLSFGLVGLFAILLFAAYVTVNGLRVCALLALAAIIRSLSNDDVGYTEEEADISGELSDMLWGREDAVHSVNYWLFLIFVILSVALLAVIIFRRRAEFRRFLARLRAWLMSLIEMLLLPVRDAFDVDNSYCINFADEEKRLQKNEIKAKRREERNARMSWHDFCRMLRAKDTDRAKYRYAYSVFVDRLCRTPTFVKRSDTPRRICERLKASGRVASRDEIEAVTEAFEQLEFADKPATPATEEALAILCDKIRESME